MSLIANEPCLWRHHSVQFVRDSEFNFRVPNNVAKNMFMSLTKKKVGIGCILYMQPQNQCVWRI